MTKIVRLGEICRLEYGSSLPQKTRKAGQISVYGSNGVVGMHDVALTSGATIIIGRKGSIGQIAYSEKSCWPIDTTYYIDHSHTSCDLEWLSLLLPSLKLSDLNKASGVPGLNRDDAYALKVVLHARHKQQAIAACLKAQLTAVEDARQAAQAQLSDAKRLVAAILETAFAAIAGSKLVKIGDVAKTTSGTTPSRSRQDYWQPRKYPWVKTGEVVFKPIRDTEEYISERALAECSLSVLPPGTVLIAMYGQGKTRGQSAVLEVAATTNQACFAIPPCEALHPQYLQLWLRHRYEALRTLSEARGGNQSNLNGGILNAFEVPMLPRARQEALADRIASALDEVEQLRVAIELRLVDIEQLPARLLAQAFGGSEEGTQA